jgi:ribonuclease HI
LPKVRAGTGIVFVTLDEAITPYSFTLNSAVSNNTAEYEALIIGLEMAQNMGLKMIQIYGDSLLIINQLLGTYAVKKLELVPYFLKTKELISQFSDVKIKHIIKVKITKLMRWQA